MPLDLRSDGSIEFDAAGDREEGVVFGVGG